MKKQDLKNLLEPFIFDKLKQDKYEIKTINSKKLLTWNRLDLAFKLFYLDNKDTNIELAKSVYKEDIKAQTLGKFIEYGNELEKNNFRVYLDKFCLTYDDIKANGFNEKQTIIPLSSEQSIINGSHRLASAIALDKDISYIVTEQKEMIADYKYFYDRDTSQNILDLVTKKFIEYSNSNTYIAFLWPSGRSDRKKAESKFSNIVYKKEIELTPSGGFNLLIELYRHMEWVGAKESGFEGGKQKLIECFPTFDPFTVIVFQEENLDKVRVIKEEVRKIFNIGFSSIHITDTKDEAIRIANLIFNENGIHFLNYANPYKYISLNEKLDTFKDFLDKNQIKKNEVLIDGSVTLSLYGLRKNEDIDFLILDNKRIKYVDSEFETHDSELIYHQENKSNLIYDHRYYFQYKGFKFISFNQLYKMKKIRNEEKDINDCNIMNSLLENNQFKKIQSKIKQIIFYWRIKSSRHIRLGLLSFLRITGLYIPIRLMYRKLKGIK